VGCFLGDIVATCQIADYFISKRCACNDKRLLPMVLLLSSIVGALDVSCTRWQPVSRCFQVLLLTAS